MKLYQVESFENTSKESLITSINDWLALEVDKVEKLEKIIFGTRWKEIKDGDVFTSGTFHTAELIYETTADKL